MTSPLFRLLGLALLLLSSCSADKAPRENAGGPALWRVQKGDVDAYVFGTIHVLPAGVAWETARMRDAMTRADRLVLEAAGLDDAAGSQAIFQKMGQSPDLPPITQRVPPAQRGALEALIAKGGMSEPMLSAYESWAAAMLVSTVMQSELALSGAEGVEPALTKEFRAAGKPVEGLETIADQFGLFDHLPENTQRAFLSETVGQAGDMRAQFDRMMAAWMRGDTPAIARDFVAELASEPELVGPLLTDRNRRWANAVAGMRGRPFIAVGAAHLAGPDNLISLLQAKGFMATRVQ
jgi:uncharacterized protein YbaP (TraB family)